MSKIGTEKKQKNQKKSIEREEMKLNSNLQEEKKEDHSEIFIDESGIVIY